MSEGFQSIKQLEQAVQALKEFAHDALYGSMFELFDKSDGATVLFGCGNADRIERLALMVNPDLKTYCIDAQISFEKDEVLGQEFRHLSNDRQDALYEMVFAIREAYLTIGIFLGARIADSTGRTLEDLGRGWMREKLGQPRHWHLLSKKESARLEECYRKSLLSLEER